MAETRRADWVQSLVKESAARDEDASKLANWVCVVAGCLPAGSPGIGEFEARHE